MTTTRLAYPRGTLTKDTAAERVGEYQPVTCPYGNCAHPHLPSEGCEWCACQGDSEMQQ